MVGERELARLFWVRLKIKHRTGFSEMGKDMVGSCKLKGTSSCAIGYNRDVMGTLFETISVTRQQRSSPEIVGD